MKKPHYSVNNDTGESKKRLEALRLEVFTHYGGKCCDCGTIDFSVLVIKPLRRNGLNGTMYWLRAHNYPDGYQLICANCIQRKKVV